MTISVADLVHLRRAVELARDALGAGARPDLLLTRSMVSTAHSTVGSILGTASRRGDADLEVGMPESIARPTGVTLVAVLTLVSGVLDIVAGTVQLVQTGNDPEADVLGGASPLVGSGVFLIVFGVALLVISVWLWRGRPAARVAVTVLEGLSIVGAVFLALAAPSLLLVSILTIAVAAVVIALLWTGRATAFFRK